MAETRGARWGRALGIVLVIFVTLAWVEAGAPGPGSFDTLYHAKFSRLVAEGKMPGGAFPWLPATAIADRYSDESVLAHRLQAPFVARDLERGMRLYSVWQAASFFVGFHLVARALGCAMPGFLTAMAVAGSSFFLSRMLQGRPMTLALLLTLVALWAMRRERRGVLVAAGALIAQIHGSWLILVFLVAILLVWQGATERRWDLRSLAAVMGGVVLGLALHPDFPHSLGFTLWHMRVVGGEEALTEWRSLDVYTLTWWNGGVLALFLGTAVAGLARPARLEPDTRAFVVLFLVTMVLGWKSTRFLDFWIPLGLIACGLAWRDMGIEAWMEEGRQRHLAAATGFVGAIASAAYFVTEVRTGMQRYDPAPYRTVWKEARASGLAADEVVFNSNWGDFFPLWYLDDARRYATGQNPGFLRARDPALARLHESIAAGEVDLPSVAMREKFGARLCLVSPRHPGLRAKLARDPLVELVTREGAPGLSLYRIRPELLDLALGWKAPLVLPGERLRASARAVGGYLTETGPLVLRTIDPATTLALRVPMPWSGRVGVRLEARAQPPGTAAQVGIEGAGFAGITGDDVLQAVHHVTVREPGSAVMNITLRTPGGPATLELTLLEIAPAHPTSK